MNQKGDFRPRVLLLGAESQPSLPGGLNRYLSDLVTALGSQDVLARAVVVGSGHRPSDQSLPVSFTPCGSHEDPLIKRLMVFRRAAWRAGRGATLVDVHFALYAFLPVLTTRLRRLPLVVHFQGPWAEENLYTDHSKVNFQLRRLIEKVVYRRAKHCVTLSAAFKRILVEQYSVSPWKVSVIPPGVDLEKFSPGPKAASRKLLGIPPDAWVVTSARRLVDRMGIDVLLHAWAEFAGAAKPSPILLIVGDGPARLKLEKLAAQLGVSDSVRFLGKVEENRLVTCFRAADVSVVPSRSLEGFGLVVLESLACGTPVIASDIGGLPEALRPLDPKLLTPAGNAGSLADLLLAAQQDNFLPSSRKCRAYARRFSWETAGAANIDVYKSVLRARKDRRKLKVVYVDHCAQLSGGELALLRLLPKLEQVDAHVILAEDGPLVPKLMAAGVSVEVLTMGESGRGLHRERVDPGKLPLAGVAQSAAYVARLTNRIRQLRPDLVHTNSLKAAVYGGLAARLAGRPVIWHLRDRVSTDYLPRAAVWFVQQMGRRLPQGVTANAHHTLATLAPGAQSTVIPSPVEFAAPPKKERVAEKGGGPVRVGMVGRLAPWKGQDIFLRSFARAFPSGSERAVIVGGPLFGEEQYARQLQALSQALGLEGRIDFTGFQEDVPAVLSQLDIAVHASTIPEPFGLVVAEAMAAGLPVVAAAAGGPSEMIRDGDNGILYPPGDVAALSDALKRLAGSPELRRRLGSKGRATAKQFAPEAVADQVWKFYRQVLFA